MSSFDTTCPVTGIECTKLVQIREFYGPDSLLESGHGVCYVGEDARKGHRIAAEIFESAIARPELCTAKLGECGVALSKTCDKSESRVLKTVGKLIMGIGRI